MRAPLILKTSQTAVDEDLNGEIIKYIYLHFFLKKIYKQKKSKNVNMLQWGWLDDCMRGEMGNCLSHPHPHIPPHQDNHISPQYGNHIISKNFGKDG